MRVRQIRFFWALLLLLATAFAPADAVINGTVAGGPTHQQWPVGIFDASELPPGLGGASCSNFLIAPDWVLTAGICVASIPIGTHVNFFAPVDSEGCGGPHGQVSEVFTYPSNDVQLLHLNNVCGLHFAPFILNDGVAPAVGAKLYDLGWGGSSGGPPLTGSTTVTAKSGLASDEIAFTGANLFCTGTNDDGGPHFDYGSNGFPVAYAIFGYSDAGCSQYNISVRIDALIAFITSHVSTVCLRSNPSGPNCDGLFRNSFDPALN
jgi:hypothetical protein